MALSRQQIRERKRTLEKHEHATRTRQQSLQELNEAERLLDQKRASAAQSDLQTASLCVALLSQVPEHRTGCVGIANKAIDFLDALITARHAEMSAPELPEDDDEEDEDEDPIAAVA